MKLYTYFRSSAAYRVRIALALKQLPYEAVPVHLLKDGGQQLQADYKRLNPLGLLPTLLNDENQALTQSLAIIEYLEEVYPERPLLPALAHDKALVRAFAQTIACDIHPLNNLRVLKYLSAELQLTDEQRNTWYAHWLHQGFAALEKLLNHQNTKHEFCFSNAPGLAECCLIPQIYNARRFNIGLDPYPNIQRITAACEALPAFQHAAPEQQHDYEAPSVKP